MINKDSRERKQLKGKTSKNHKTKSRTITLYNPVKITQINFFMCLKTIIKESIQVPNLMEKDMVMELSITVKVENMLEIGNKIK